MLPTPDTSHVSYNRVYEPAEDSFLLLDTLSSPSETAFLQCRFNAIQDHISTGIQAQGVAPHTRSPAASSPPFVVEVGSGSGVVIAFLTAHARTIFGPSASSSSSLPPILSAAVDVNRFACAATTTTVHKAVATAGSGLQKGEFPGCGLFLGAVQADLLGPLRPGIVDVLVFNPPYVPTPDLPALPTPVDGSAKPSFDEESHLLALSYAGGRDGMETTDRLLEALPRALSPLGVAYVLLCAQNRPEEVKRRICEGSYGFGAGGGWRAETVGESGRKAGWEKLQIVRIWKDADGQVEEGLL
ncbi:hypothetical protein VTK73DRAFT_7431 [Phialemonium thermophilum]|uniref:ERF1 methyltransferase catalytic subunit MTQ2 n=1 Tax=Phialemonium thermophilum TaxID=223376 RepID=A0ABR3WER8_9PEZI